MQPVTQLRAAELKKRFNVFGQYYNSIFDGNEYPCRSLLELVSQDKTPNKPIDLIAMEPDLIVVMLNPGASRPRDGAYRPQVIEQLSDLIELHEMVPAVPDTTQYQIMRLMVAQGYQHARILNLSDLRTPKSIVLLKQIQTLGELSTDMNLQWHSIFSKKRLVELNTRTANHSVGKGTFTIPIVVGWGRFEQMRDYAQRCLNYFKQHNVIGVPAGAKDGTLFGHPSPMLQAKKEQWLNNILDLLHEKSSARGRV